MLAEHLRKGKLAEKLACDRLVKNGYRILECNRRYQVGEIDIIARENTVLCFVEVRSRSSQQWGGPLDSIGDRKRKRLLRAARCYLRGSGADYSEIRFDVVSILWTDNIQAQIEIIRHAFEDDSQGGPEW